MKVAFVSQPFDKVIPPNQSSVGIITYQITKKLAGNAEIVVYAGTKNRVVSQDYRDGIQYRWIPTVPNRLSRRFDRLVFQNLLRKNRISGFDLPTLRYIWNIAYDLRRQKCDLIHLHNYSQFAPILKFFNPKAHLVLHMHCEWLTQLDRATIESRLGHLSLIVGVSEYITEKIRSRFPQIASRCHTVHNGVDGELFSPVGETGSLQKKAPQVLFVGRVSPEKGVHDLIQAYRLLADRFPELCLRIVGGSRPLPKEFLVGISDEAEVINLEPFLQGDYTEQILNNVPVNLMDRIEFSGFLPTEQMPDVYRQASILVNPSYSESFGMSLIEAMSCGVPVIATRQGGMPEVVVDGETGCLVERGNVDQLAGSIGYLLEHANLREAMGRKGRQRALEHFSWEKIGGELLECYRTLA